MSKNKTIAYIVGHRNSNDPNRLKNLLFVLKWLDILKKILIKHNIILKIVVVEQDDFPKIKGMYDLETVTHIFVYNPELFNRGWGFNVGFKTVNADYYFFADNDIILEVRDIINVFLKCFKYEAVKPYFKIFDSTKEHIESSIFNTINEKNNEKWEKLFQQRKHTCFGGGIVGLSKKAVYVVSGWDERFRGRGWEDYAFTAKLKLFLYSRFSFKYTALHLWHELEDPCIKKNNFELIKKYQSYDVHDYLKQIESAENFGCPLKYSTFGKEPYVYFLKFAYFKRRHNAIKLYNNSYNWVKKQYDLPQNKRKLYTYLYLSDQLYNIKHHKDECLTCESGFCGCKTSESSQTSNMSKN
jgi:hypothetical protein